MLENSFPVTPSLSTRIVLPFEIMWSLIDDIRLEIRTQSDGSHSKKLEAVRRCPEAATDFARRENRVIGRRIRGTD
jgi:hypothetical protein